MKKIVLFLLLSYPFSLFALDIEFNEIKKAENEWIQYMFRLANQVNSFWYADFWNNVKATKKHHFTTYVWWPKRELPWYAPVKAPIFNDPIIYLKNKLWKNRFNNLLKENYLRIYWTRNRCDFNIGHAILWQDNMSCIYWDYKDIYTNTVNTAYYYVESDIDQKINLKIFPVTNKDYVFFRADDEYYEKFPILTLFDSSLEYYDLRAAMPPLDGVMNTFNFNKKYVLTKFDKRNYPLPNMLSLSNEMYNTTYTLVPYYETEIDLKKWWNTVIVSYKSYSHNSDGDIRINQ